MIPRNRPGAPKPEPEAAPGTVEIIEVRQLEFSFGPGDFVSYELGPDDSFTHYDGAARALLVFKDGERVEIDMRQVRLFSERTVKVTRSRAPFVPADPGLEVAPPAPADWTGV